MHLVVKSVVYSDFGERKVKLGSDIVLCSSGGQCDEVEVIPMNMVLWLWVMVGEWMMEEGKKPNKIVVRIMLLYQLIS